MLFLRKIISLQPVTYEAFATQEEERQPTPPPDIKYYTRPNGQELSVQLVTTHPLWVRPAQLRSGSLTQVLISLFT